MSNNMYGGITYPNSPFSFDRTYYNYTTAVGNATDDGVLIGRYVLVQYCDEVLPAGERYDLDNHILNGMDLPEGSYTEDKYIQYSYNLLQDQTLAALQGITLTHSYDRYVLQKVYVNNAFTYVPVFSLNLSLSATTNVINQVVVSSDDNPNSILTLNGKILSSEVGLVYDENAQELKLIGPNEKSIGEGIPVGSFIKGGIFKEITFDDANNTITFTWVTIDEKGEETTNTQTISLYDIIDPYKPGDGINVDTIPNEEPTISIKLDKTTENFLTLSSNGLKITGINEISAKAEALSTQVEANKSNIETLQEDVEELNIELADEILVSVEDLSDADFEAKTETMAIIINGQIDTDDPETIISVSGLKNYATKDEVDDKIDTAIQKLETSVINEVSGEFLTITDASPIEHVMNVKISSTNFISYITDLSAVTLSKYGKNLLGEPTTLSKLTYENGIYTQTEPDLRDDPLLFQLDGIKNDKYQTNYANYKLAGANIKPGRYFIPFEIDNIEFQCDSIRFGLSGAKINNFAKYNNILPNGKYTFSFELLSIQQGDISWTNCQIEAGTTVTAYEPYITPVEYAISADGTIEGVTSLYPVTNLFTDTEGVLINCKYIQTMGFDYGAEQVLVNNSKIQQLEERFADAEQNVQADWNEENQESDAYILNKPSIPTKLSQFENDLGAVPNTRKINDKSLVEDITLTPSDIGAAAINDDTAGANITYSSNKINGLLDGKVDTETGKGLSTNDFTDDYKSKVDTALQSYVETDPTVPAWAKTEAKPTYTKQEIGLGNVANILQYSADNPPPYPVTKVNGETGEVTITPDNIGAVPNTRTVNGQALSADIALTPNDIGAAVCSDIYFSLPKPTDDIVWTNNSMFIPNNEFKTDPELLTNSTFQLDINDTPILDVYLQTPTFTENDDSTEVNKAFLETWSHIILAEVIEEGEKIGIMFYADDASLLSSNIIVHVKVVR